MRARALNFAVAVLFGWAGFVPCLQQTPAAPVEVAAAAACCCKTACRCNHDPQVGASCQRSPEATPLGDCGFQAAPCPARTAGSVRGFDHVVLATAMGPVVQLGVPVALTDPLFPVSVESRPLDEPPRLFS